MTYISPQERDRTLRRLQLEQGGPNSQTDPPEIGRLQQQIDILNLQVATLIPPVTNRQGILNMIRNGDHNHSVNTWWETAPATGGGIDKNVEAANVYAYPAFDPITITDAAMSSTVSPNDLHSASNPFTADMDGRYAIVEGAGAAGADLVGIITYTGPGTVNLSNPCLTTVTGATARINLLKLTHTNNLNSLGAVPNDALKDASHSAIGSNIADPDWHKENGTVRIGVATDIVGYPFGKFDNTGLNYVPLHQLFPGRTPIVRLNIARANQYVKIPGKIYLGIYNNNEAVLDWVKGAPFSLDTDIDPPGPATTVSTDYMVTIETDQGFTLVSEVVTLANAPDDTAMSGGTRVTLFWTLFAGATVTTIYRRRAAGNVFKMEAFESGANSWTDVNLSTRFDTGTTSFPAPGDASSTIAAYWATADGELDDITYDGQADRFWQPVIATLPFPATVDLGALFDPHFIVGLTMPLATQLTDVVTHSTTSISSAAAQFTAAMTGKAFTLTKSDGTASVTGTFTYVSATNGTLSAAATWTETGSTLVIDDSQPHGLYYDLVGVSLNDGEWDYHIEDNSELRGQQVAANPNGSHQGGTGGGEPGGGGGGVNCVLDSSVGQVRGISNTDIIEKRADEILITDRFWNGMGFEDSDFNTIEWIKVHTVSEIKWLLTATKRLGCTRTHRVIDDRATSVKCGIAVADLFQGRNVLISDNNSTKIEQVLGLPSESGNFKVISFGLKETARRTCHLFIWNGIVSHNRKIVEP